MPHVDIKCFPRELTDEQKTALAADITEVLIRHLNSKESAVSVALTQVEPDAWQAVWDSEIAPQMAQLIKQPGYSMSPGTRRRCCASVRATRSQRSAVP